MTEQRETPPGELPALPWPPLLLVAVVAVAWALGRIAPLSWPGVEDGPASRGRARHRRGRRSAAHLVGGDAAAGTARPSARAERARRTSSPMGLIAYGAIRSTSPTC